MTTKKLHSSALPAAKKSTWVQTDKATHEAWGNLITAKPRAGALLHHMTARAGSNNVLVISQKTLSKIMGCGLRTVQYAIADLVEGRWIQVVKLNGPGTVSAYVLNDRVAWSQTRQKLHLSMFSATVVADYEDQEAALLGEGLSLRQIPSLYSDEQQLPSGPGEDPPSQPSLGGLEPLLPSLEPGLDRNSQRRLDHIDPETGEIS